MNNFSFCAPPGGNFKVYSIKDVLRKGAYQGAKWLIILLLGILLIPAAVCLGAIGVVCSVLDVILKGKLFRH